MQDNVIIASSSPFTQSFLGWLGFFVVLVPHCGLIFPVHDFLGREEKVYLTIGAFIAVTCVNDVVGGM